MPSAVTHPESLFSAVGSNAPLITLHNFTTQSDFVEFLLHIFLCCCRLLALQYHG